MNGFWANDTPERDTVKADEETAGEKKLNGTVSRILQFGQLLVLGAVLPWGVWVTGQIYGLQTSVAQCAEWRHAREKANVATLTDVEIIKRDVELSRLKVKDEIITTMSSKMDAMILKLAEIDLKLTKHEAETARRFGDPK